MARESALACHDILATIFDHLLPASLDDHEATADSRRICQKALAASARACTTLSHHALNVLWRELNSIHPLLKTLPNYTLVEWQTLRGAISDEDWTRFQLYAGRVRSIAGTLDPELLNRIHPSVWMFLAARCKGSPLMPRLRNLTALDLCLSETSGLALLLSPSLRRLDLIFALELEEDEDREIISNVTTTLFQTLPFMAPNLEALNCVLDIDLDDNEDIIESFTQFPGLKSLSVCSKLALDEYALDSLSHMATLRDLSCTINLPSISALTTPPDTFQDLTRLDVTGTFDDLIAFIDAYQLPSLVALELSITQPPSTGEPADLFAAVCRRCNAALLTSVRVSLVYDYRIRFPPPNSLVQYFKPLLAFRDIESFSLSFSRTAPSIHDDDLAQFGAAWPRLSTFDVMYWQDDMPADTARPTVSGLVDLAQRCPRLSSFGVPVLDATVVPGKDATLPVGHGLRSLSSRNALLPPSGSPAYLEVATLLSRVFPEIGLRDAQRVVRPDYKEWKTFLEVLETMRR